MKTSENKLLKWLKSLGPGIITAALVFGPSKLTITSKLGALYGYSPLWIVVVAIFFMAIFTNMATRIGEASDKSLITIIRQKWGNIASIAVGIGIFCVATSFQAGNAIGVGISLGELYDTSPVPWVIAFTILGIALLFFRTFYSVLEKTMILLIILMLFSFITTFFLAAPDYGKIATGFVTPNIPAGSEGLLIAFMASCFSIVGALYQSYLIQERIRINPALRNEKNDGSTGIILLGVMSAIVIICGAAVLNPKGIQVNSANDMAKALEPIFGNKASTLFLIGLFGAAFSSLIGNASVGGTLLSDGLGYGSKFSSTITRGLIAVVMIVGSIIAVAFGKLPLELIVFAQSVTIFIVPFIGICLYLIANDEAIMGEKKNGAFTRIVGAAGLLIIASLAIINIEELFFK